MPDDPQQPAIDPSVAEELETLRRTVAELREKNTNRKARIAELEASLTETQGQLAEANATIQQVTIEGPFKAMAESISIAPELWMEQFSKQYKIELREGTLTLLSASDGKPVQKDGKPVPFERGALAKFLTDGDSPQAKTFQVLTVVSHASGGSGDLQRRPKRETSKQPGIQFGLGRSFS